MRCFIQDKYKIKHSHVDTKLRNKFVVLGNLFERKPICAWCLQRLCIIADNYGSSQRRDVRGGTNVQAMVSLKELINRSPLKPVFNDYDVSDIKYAIDKHLFEVEPEQPIRPTLKSEIDRISRLSEHKNNVN